MVVQVDYDQGLTKLEVKPVDPEIESTQGNNTHDSTADGTEETFTADEETFEELLCLLLDEDAESLNDILGELSKEARKGPVTESHLVS